MTEEMFSFSKRGSSSRHLVLFWCCRLFISLLQSRSVNVAGEASSTGINPVVELSPYCDAKAHVIYFVDKEPAAIRSYHPNEDSYYGASIVDAQTNKTFTMTFAIPIEGHPNMFVCGLDATLGVVTWDGKINTTLNPHFYIKVKGGTVKTGSTDSNGLLYIVTAGTTSDTGSMYGFTGGKISDFPITFTGLGDNIAFSPTKFYYTDSDSRIIYGLNYDPKNMNFSNSYPVFNMTALSLLGVPGGLTVDREGNLWISCHVDDIIGFDPKSRTVIGTLPVPDYAKLGFTSVVLCGTDLGDLYATTNTDPKDQITPVIKINGYTSTMFGTGGVPAKFPTAAPPGSS